VLPLVAVLLSTSSDEDGVHNRTACVLKPKSPKTRASSGNVQENFYNNTEIGVDSLLRYSAV
jgi:hypothetical protein